MTSLERQASLKGCAGIAQPRAEVERMLEAREHLPDWMDQALLVVPLARLLAWKAAALADTLIPRDRPGGMGLVYLAE